MQTIKQRSVLFRAVLGMIALLAMATLSCKAVTYAFVPPTSTPTFTPVPPTATPTATPSPTVTPTPMPEFNAAGVRMCYYIPGVSTLAQMPPEVLATPTPYALPELTPPPNTQVDSATTQKQLKTFTALYETVRKNYVYSDFNGRDWKAIGDKYKKLVKGGLTDDDFYFAMSLMIYELGDEHSAFMSPNDVKASEAELQGERNYVGIGAMVFTIDDPTTGVITGIFPGSPAEEAGLRLHDKLLKVDDLPLHDPETGESNTLGEPGTRFTLTYQRPGEPIREVEITRRAITGAQPIEYCMVPNTRIGYIYLPTFYDDSIDDQVRNAIKKMTSDGNLEGLVIDNRMNGGGISTVVEPILELFTDGVLGHYVSQTEREAFRVHGRNIGGSQEVPLVILVGLDTASYGEIFSGVLRAAGRAQIVGQNTLGNVEVLRVFPFEDGSQVLLANATFEPVGEASGIWERTGIVPDYIVPTRWDLFTEATDPALAKAVEILLNK